MNWLKHNWKAITLLISGLVGIGILTACILALRQDGGLLAPGKCKEIKWVNTPVQIRFVDDVASAGWYSKLKLSAFWWKNKSGINLFEMGSPLKFGEEAIDPVILFEVVSDGSFDPDHPGKTKLVIDKFCNIRRAHITVDGLRRKDPSISKKHIKHELGHALGLDHDDFEKSIMYRGGKAIYWGMDEILLTDKKLLYETYVK